MTSEGRVCSACEADEQHHRTPFRWSPDHDAWFCASCWKRNVEGRMSSPCRCVWVEGFGMDRTACRLDWHNDYCENRACCSPRGHDGDCDERAAL